MINLNEYLDTPDQFERWLESKFPGDIVGTSGEFDHCPIAKWLELTISIKVMTVEYISIGSRIWVNTAEDRGNIESPEWARNFMHFVDTAYKDGTPITASTAIDILRRITNG